MSQYLMHATLNTGHTRRSYRGEVSAEAIETCMDLLDDALEQPQVHAVIPGITPPLTLKATAEGAALIATVWSAPVEIRAAAPMRAPLLTIGAVRRATAGAKLWQVMHETEMALATSGQPQPGAPWVASRIEVGVTVLAEEMRETMTMLGDFARCLGWAWLECREAKHAG